MLTWNLASANKAVPLTSHGHTRPINHLSFSSMVEDDQFFVISACKGMELSSEDEAMTDTQPRSTPDDTKWHHRGLVMPANLPVLA